MKLIAALLSVLLVAGCAGAASSENTLDPINNWYPGLVGVAGSSATGFGPAGYPGVRDDSIDSEPVQQFLASVLPQLIDFPAGSVRLAAKGNLISVPTLLMCGAEYESELTRLVRRKLELENAEGNFGEFTAEAIQYESAEAVTAAFNELTKVQKTCGAAGEYEVDGVSIQIDFKGISIPGSAKLVSRENRYLVSWTSVTDSQSTYTQQIWQQRGNTVVMVEVTEVGTTEIAAEKIEFAFQQATTIAARLKAADPLDIGVFD
jgi:hypothetical protein